jgi:hypothetical protein
MKLEQYIGLFLMLLMLGSALQPLEQFVVDTDIELSDTMEKEAQDSLEKDLKSDLFLVVVNHHDYSSNFNLEAFSYDCLLNLSKGFDDIVLPPPEC